MEIPQKVIETLPYNPEIPLVGVYLTALKEGAPRDT